MNPLVSVIIPVYKVEEYFKKCIKSVLKQTYKELEILLIDDGSPDNCPKLCDEVASKDSRVKVFHIENGGVSNARNVGLSVATGKYVMFVDSDDWMPKNAVEKMVAATEKSNSDYCYGNVVIVGSVFNRRNANLFNTEILKTEPLKMIEYIDKINAGPWAKLYRLEILKKYELQYPKGIAYGEDRLFLWQYLQHCHKMCSVSDIVYYYNQMVSGAATKKHHNNIHLWLADSKKELKSLFAEHMNNQEVSFFVGKQSFKLFNHSCLHHVGYEKTGEKEKTIEKLKETYSVFKEYIDDLRTNELIKENIGLKEQVEMYYSYIDSDDFEGLYNRLRLHKKQNAINPIVLKLRKIILSIKKFVYFKILG